MTVTPRIADPSDQFAGVLDLGRIEAAHRLVEKEDLRSGGETRGDLEPFLLAAASGSEAGLRRLPRQIHYLQRPRGVRFGPRPVRARAGRAASVTFSSTGELAERFDDLERARDPAANHGVRRESDDALARQLTFTAARRGETGHQIERGLSCRPRWGRSGRGARPGPDRTGQIGNGAQAAEVLGQVSHAQRASRTTSPLALRAFPEEQFALGRPFALIPSRLAATAAPGPRCPRACSGHDDHHQQAVEDQMVRPGTARGRAQKSSPRNTAPTIGPPVVAIPPTTAMNTISTDIAIENTASGSM